MKKDMIILSVGSTKGTRQGSMFYVEFETENILTIQDVLGLEYNEKKYYFEVVEIIANNVDKLKVKALNVGYYNLFQKQKNFDIRMLLNKEIFIVEDENILKQIDKEKGYC